MFTIIAVVLFVIAVVAFVYALMYRKQMASVLVMGVIGVLLLLGSFWFATHWIVPNQYVGVAKSTVSQDLYGPYESGLAPKPVLSTVYKFPASSDYQRCETYTPAIKGSYGITVDLCYYYDTGNVDWIKEINKTGKFNSDVILDVWRNSVVGEVAEAVKLYTPEQLSENRGVIEEQIFKNVYPWFDERGINLKSLSFKDWDFISDEVAAAFDASIVSQRKIAEQEALYQAAIKARTRELYEAETKYQVAQKQANTIKLLDFTGNDAIQYLWIQALAENGKVPDTVILGNTPVTTPSN